MNTLTILTSAALLMWCTSCQREISVPNTGNDTGAIAKHSFVISFGTRSDMNDLVFNQAYHNAFGETFSITTFKYYIGNIELHNSSNAVLYQTFPNSYYLIDAADSTLSNITLEAPEGSYDAIHFMLGVDSASNVSGAQEGALDPANGMFWTWNTGYIMAKLEGSSPFSNLPGNRIQYHVGGFKHGESVVKNIVLNLPEGKDLLLQSQHNSKVIIHANVNMWFSGVHNIRIADTAVCMTPGSLATSISDNYSKMFSIANVIN